MVHPSNSESRGFRPVAYVTIEDAAARVRVIETLEREGWTALLQPSGFHLLQAIADVIEGKDTRLDPMLIVIDAYARGCAGTTIAAGLRDLGISIPIVLISTPDQVPPLPADEAVHLAGTSRACEIVAALARAAGGLPPGDRPTPAIRGSGANIDGPREMVNRSG